MRAVVQQRYGGPEQLTYAEVPDPTPGKGEVLVEVRAAAIDSGTQHLMEGTPYLVRPYSGLRRLRFPIPGRDVSGVVVALGPEVDGVAVGDEVLGTAHGSLAELAVVPVQRLAAKSAALSFADAAALPVSGLTALQAWRKAGPLPDGARVLVTGASGGVGTYAVQLAVASGADVVAVCSAAKADLVRGLGVSTVLDYARDDLASSGPYDLILDIAGGGSLRSRRRLLTERGTLVLIGSDQGGRVLGGMQRPLAAVLLTPFVRQRLTGLVAGELGEDMAELVDLVGQGRLRPVLTTYPFTAAITAVEDLVAGRVRGKAVIVLG